MNYKAKILSFLSFALIACLIAVYAQDKLDYHSIKKLDDIIELLGKQTNDSNAKRIDATFDSVKLNVYLNTFERSYITKMQEYLKSKYLSSKDYGSEEILLEAHNLALNTKNPNLVMYSFDQLYLFYQAKIDYSNQLKTILSEEAYLKKYCFEISNNFAFRHYRKLGLLLYYDKDYSNALVNFKYSLALLQKEDSTELFRKNYTQNLLSNIALCYQKEGLYKKAEFYLKLAIKASYSTNFVEQALGVNYCNIGHIYLLQKDTAKAIEHYVKGLEYTTKPQNLELNHAIISITQLVPVLLAKNKIKEAEYYVKKSDFIYNNFPTYKLHGRYFYTKALYNYKINNINQAILFALRSAHIKDSILQFSHDAFVSKILINNELNNRLKENAELSVQLKKIEFRNLLIISISSAIILLLMFLVFWFKRYNKQNKQLKETLSLLRNSNATIIKNNDKLLEYDIRKNQLLKAVAHDIRSPISNVLALHDLILEELQDQPNIPIQNFKLLKISAESAMGIMEDLLDQEAIETGKINLKISNFNLRNVVFKAIELLYFKAKAKNQHINVEVEGNIFINGDENRIMRVLQNLIGNSIKFSKNNTDIHVNAKVADKNVIITVKDQGIGIHEDKLAHLFDSLHIKGTEGTSGERSYGLGLSIVYGIVKAHNGQITVESEVNKGSKFVITIPINQ